MLVLYTASGAKMSAARVLSGNIIVEHKAYWASAKSANEALYLLALLNSTAVLAKIKDMQTYGEAGTRRDFDNLVWTLPIPEYDRSDPVHRDLAAAAGRAEKLAKTIDLSSMRHFVEKREKIREVLVADGVAGEIEALVDAILPP